MVMMTTTGAMMVGGSDCLKCAKCRIRHKRKENDNE